MRSFWEELRREAFIFLQIRSTGLVLEKLKQIWSISFIKLLFDFFKENIFKKLDIDEYDPVL